MQMPDNAGATNEHRAELYGVRYPAIYVKAAKYLSINSALSAVEARLSPLRAFAGSSMSFSRTRTGTPMSLKSTRVAYIA
jgi:hypothetical protein